MSITLIVLAGLLAAFALTGLVTSFAVQARSIPQNPPPKTWRAFLLEMLGWSTVIAVHMYHSPQFSWWFVAVGGGWLGLIAAKWYFDPSAKRPRV